MMIMSMKSYSIKQISIYLVVQFPYYYVVE